MILSYLIILIIYNEQNVDTWSMQLRDLSLSKSLLGNFSFKLNVVRCHHLVPIISIIYLIPFFLIFVHPLRNEQHELQQEINL